MVTNPTPATTLMSSSGAAADAAPRFLGRDAFDRLLEALHADGRTVIGPQVRDGAIVYDEIDTVADLPAGWHDEQAPGRYRLEQTGDDRLFDYVVGPTAWKRFTFPPRVPMSRGYRTDGHVTFEGVPGEAPRLAFLGVRACEIAALLIQDRVLTGGPAVDGDYAARRAASLVIAVECVRPASTCFCTSMASGPEVTSGFDVALTELDDGFVVRTGSRAGEDLIATLDLPTATADQVATARGDVAAARARIGDPVPTAGLPARLIAAAGSPRWAEIADRCLACTNCTMVCPTCFCTSVSVASDLTGSEAVKERTWDSCFTLGFARVAGGNFRPRVQDRYRQWLTHKFGTWWDQFGTAGCVGCGRCVTWCPVGIDVREEVVAVAPPRPLRAGTPIAGLTTIATAPPPPVEPIVAPTVVAEVVEHRTETADTATIRLATDDARLLAGRPGQFVMAVLPAFSAAPISVSRFLPDGLELTIRAAGASSRALCGLRPGDTVGLRGPLGRGWPVDAAQGRDVIVVTGGIGLAPLRPLLDALLAQRDRFGAIRLMYGARTPADRLYVDELSELAARPDLEVGLTVDRAGPDWFGRVGVVTTLFDTADWDGAAATAFICGPEKMMVATAEVLQDLGSTRDRIFVTLERNMACGVGLCGHCQLGKAFVCKDGPVFSLAELGDAFAREGL
jgi:NAD(P)H-flavin reductase/formate hydrogenlyase subunit 6/NADH:ubiquinone oxidoreductase subunit I